MNRQTLIDEVKTHYSRIADQSGQIQGQQPIGSMTNDAYYEALLSMVIGEISKGTFDQCRSGKEIVEQVANEKDEWLTRWQMS